MKFAPVFWLLLGFALGVGVSAIVVYAMGSLIDRQVDQPIRKLT